MFIPFKYDKHGRPPIEYLPAGAIVTTPGLPLYFDTGALAVAAATQAPAYICLHDSAGATLSSGTLIPVEHISKDTVYQSVLSANSSSIALGVKYTIATGGAGVTATTTNGVAEVVGFDGKAAGDTVYVRF